MTKEAIKTIHTPHSDSPNL